VELFKLLRRSKKIFDKQATGHANCVLKVYGTAVSRYSQDVCVTLFQNARNILQRKTNANMYMKVSYASILLSKHKIYVKLMAVVLKFSSRLGWHNVSLGQ
jgi:hypothetical protein